MINFFFIILSLFQFLNAYASDHQTISVAISASPSNLIPFYSIDANSQNINRMLHTSLVEINDEMNITCNLCQNYFEKMELKKHIIYFELKKNLTFSDGSPVRSQDVYNSWIFFSKDEKIKSTFMASFESIEDIKIVDPLHLKIIYSSFSLDNLANLTMLKIVKITNPKHENISLNDILGAGEYLIKKITPLEIIIEPRNKNHPSFIFKTVKDETTLALKLINHEIDLSVANLSPRKIEWLRKNGKFLKVWDLPSSNYLYLAMNFRNPILKDKRFRQALSLLIPRKDLLRYKIKGTATLSNGMFSPAFKEMYDLKEVDRFSPNEARALFKNIGCTKNQFGHLICKGQPVALDWKVNNNKASLEVVEIIKNYFEKEGIIVNMVIQEWGTFMNSYTSGNFDLVISQWMGFTGPNMLEYVFHSKNIPPRGGNRISYINMTFDKLVEDASVELKSEIRNRLYKNAYKIINDDQVYISLWHPNIIWIGSKCLKNIKLEPTGSFISLPKVEYICE